MLSALSHFVRLQYYVGFSFLHFIHYLILLIFHSFSVPDSLNLALFTPRLTLYGHILDLKLLIFSSLFDKDLFMFIGHLRYIDIWKGK